MNPQEIKALAKKGYTVQEFTPYHFRIESVLDLYPKRQRYHNIRTQARGRYEIKDLATFVDSQIKAQAQVKEALPAGRWHRPENAPWWAKVAAK